MDYYMYNVVSVWEIGVCITLSHEKASPRFELPCIYKQWETTRHSHRHNLVMLLYTLIHTFYKTISNETNEQDLLFYIHAFAKLWFHFRWKNAEKGQTIQTKNQIF